MQGPVVPTFPSRGSYLDLVLRDSRLKITYERNGKINVVPYDSDHEALSLIVKLEKEDKFLFDHNTDTSRFNFNKTNWDRYQKDLSINKLKIPNNRN